MFPDKAVDFGGFEQNRLTRQSHAAQSAFFDPAHDGRAMHAAEAKGGFRQCEQRIIGAVAGG